MHGLAGRGRGQTRNLLGCKPLMSHTSSGRPLFGRRTQTIVAARKGDGKQQRKPKSAEGAATTTTNAPAPPSPPPLRIGTAPLPGGFKRQLSFVRAVKEYEKKVAQPTRATRSWRKQKQTSEEIKAEQKQREEQELRLTGTEAKNFALSQIHGSVNDYRRRTALLVDGYNVIGERPEKNGGGPDGDGSGASGLLLPGQVLEEERSKLIESLGIYSQQAGIRVICAFDAARSGAKPNSEEMLSNGVTVVFCGECEADTYIVQGVRQMLDKGYSLVVVATNDELVRIASEGPAQYHRTWGKQEVHSISVRSLKRDMLATERKLHRMLEERASPRFGMGAPTNRLSDLTQLRQRLLQGQQPQRAQAAGRHAGAQRAGAAEAAGLEQLRQLLPQQRAVPGGSGKAAQQQAQAEEPQ